MKPDGPEAEPAHTYPTYFSLVFTAGIAFWVVFQGIVAVSVLLLGGGATLQAVAVLTGGPFAVLSLVAPVGLTLPFCREEGGPHLADTTALGATPEGPGPPRRRTAGRRLIGSTEWQTYDIAWVAAGRRDRRSDDLSVPKLI